jgi:hypothetical protein
VNVKVVGIGLSGGQFAVVDQLRQYSVGSCANSHLEGGSILYQGSDIFPDLDLLGRKRFGMRPCYRGVGVHNRIQLPPMNDAIPVGSGHLGVNFR